MKKMIPQGPALVVLVGPSGGGKSTFAKQFSPHEVVSSDALRIEMAGDIRRQDMNDAVNNEFDRRILNRLELGKRVVADATHIRNTARRRTAKLAAQTGATVVYVVINRSMMAKINSAGWRAGVKLGERDELLRGGGTDLITAHEETFSANLSKILGGDGIANIVVDTRNEMYDIVAPLSRASNEKGQFPPEQAPLLDIASRGYKGILAIGDVHGNLEGLEKLLRYARQNTLFPFFMGDIVDYASDTLKTADRVAELIFRGQAAGVLGNHERKIHRFVTKERIEGIFANENGFAGTLSEGNYVTVNQIKALNDVDRMPWETRFLGMCDLLPHMTRMPRYFFVHAAANAKMLQMDEYRFNPDSPEEGLAMFGETSGKIINGFPERLYNWVDEIPPRQTVVVGHDCRCQEYPLVVTGKEGGRAIFLDTGSSKPERFGMGRLSGMALDIDWNKRNGHSLINERFVTDVDL